MVEELEEIEEDFEEVENEESTKKESKPKTLVSDDFKNIIKSYLDSYSLQDKVFASRYSNSKKNIEECCNYIVNKVMATGRNGFTDDEVFKMARDYYVDEVDKKDLASRNVRIITNHHVDKVENQPSKKASAKKEKANPTCEQLSLFDF